MKFLLLAILMGWSMQSFSTPPDSVYSWAHVASSEEDGCTYHTLHLKSQTWRSIEEVDQPVWRHWLTIIEPEKVTSKQVLLIIAGGYNDDPAPAPGPHLLKLAEATESIVAEVRMVPNQNLHFADQEKPRREHEIIAYTWDKFLETDDSTWLLRLPMTLSVVRAMDAIEEAVPELLTSPFDVEGFVLSGKSNRGWTAWTAAAADSRVTGVIPIVIDLLNLKQSMEHHYCSYGFWSPALRDYEAMGLPQRWNTPEFDKLLSLVEPFSYRKQVTMPKLIINSTGDEYFLPDSSNFYFEDLMGPKYLRYIPNTDHSLRGSNFNESVAAFYIALQNGHKLPHVSWTKGEGALQVKADTMPATVKLWTATNPSARDFRLSQIGPAWKAETLEPNAAITVPIAAPEQGWSAYLVELTFPNDHGPPITLTTDVIVTPNTLPYRHLWNTR